ncbi:LOW QUALITY PROTEIN: neuropeptide F [Drosophila sulfurigaster albostrigata]|uniref:LOW QUALITY PROTEIN: neuropeptide F n=1 Tax=Drosophila sulfurigaster albostrigata TaxID=89887 RepID=UPI002D21E610|nr:LOW QUALITY PROTEIN: neuropeptide F [Drosophila sulfurigaster albostrigata]
MSHTMRCTLVVCVALALFAAGCNVEASKTRPPRNNDISTMADALKYLQDLDVYYGDRARVRFGKRGSLMQLLRNRMLENASNNNNNNEIISDTNGNGDIMHSGGEEEPF